MRREADFKSNLYKEIRERFPGTEVIPNNPTYLQGFPDATVYFPNGKYFLLEGKRNISSSKRPNQKYYVNESTLSKNANFIYPENKEEIMKELERRYNE